MDGRAMAEKRMASLFMVSRCRWVRTYGGPLFFSHYSFLGINPQNLTDAYANYWEQDTAHTTINYSYCVNNPKHYYGYSNLCWGLTASDIQGGYTASSPKMM